VMLIFDNEDHVKPRQNGWHEVNVLSSLSIIPAPKHRVGSSQHRAARVQCSCDASLTNLGNRYGLLLHGLVNSNPIILSHFVKLINADNPTISQDHSTTFHNK
ncbi:hypothetical protein EGW08_007973, partial [Elysia chlorotica]